MRERLFNSHSPQSPVTWVLVLGQATHGVPEVWCGLAVPLTWSSLGLGRKNKPLTKFGNCVQTRSSRTRLQRFIALGDSKISENPIPLAACTRRASLVSNSEIWFQILLIRPMKDIINDTARSNSWRPTPLSARCLTRHISSPLGRPEPSRRNACSRLSVRQDRA